MEYEFPHYVFEFWLGHAFHHIEGASDVIGDLQILGVLSPITTMWFAIYIRALPLKSIGHQYFQISCVYSNPDAFLIRVEANTNTECWNERAKRLRE